MSTLTCDPTAAPARPLRVARPEPQRVARPEPQRLALVTDEVLARRASWVVPPELVAAPTPPVVAPRPAPVRLTRRGRVVVLLAGLVATLVLALVWSSGSAATEQPAHTRMVVVQPGQTLWSIASRVTHGRDTGAMVDRIVALNGLDSGVIDLGQRLRVPA